MSVKVTITVETEEGVNYTKRVRTVTRGGDNPRYNAFNTEQAIIEAGRGLSRHIADSDGDIRDDPSVSLSEAERRRHFEEPR